MYPPHSTRRPRPRLPLTGRRPAPRLPSPYRPDPKPHLTRTAIGLLVVGACIFGLAWAGAGLTGPGTVELPQEVYHPSYPVPAPGWLEPTVTPDRP